MQIKQKINAIGRNRTVLSPNPLQLEK